MYITFLSVCLIVFVRSNEFNYSQCPDPWELQTKDVMDSFDINKFVGLYYEVMYHDYTQTSCPKPSCITSNKTLNQSINAVDDHFVLDCFGKPYLSIFEFNLTSTPGFFMGTVIDGTVLEGDWFPDTVIAKGNDALSNYTKQIQYEWVIEFQCREKTENGKSLIDFIGINFYCIYNNPPQSMIDTMLNIAYQQGLGIYLERNVGITYVNQTNCTYPWFV